LLGGLALLGALPHAARAQQYTQNMATGYNPIYSPAHAPLPTAPDFSREPGSVASATEYLFTAWTLGRLVPYSGAPRRAWLRYNALSKQLVELAQSSRLSKPVDMRVLRGFTVGDSARGLQLHYRRYLNTRVEKPDLRTAFFEVHYDAGRTALLCQRVHNPSLPMANLNGFTGGNDVLRYYLKTSDNRLLHVKLQADELLAALPPVQQPALTAYCQQQHLDLHRETDVVKLLQYADHL
jgi:hypothetical protein